ncbi:MAG: TonB-dependent receptor [Marinilabiliaceae bacterium]|nr:TonB-dependent receptor [Marinilabiliaceae bacterium]
MRKLMLLMSLLVFAFSAMAQNSKTITGNVVGDDGMPIPGVNVLVKGTTTGTVTDFDGNYSINVMQDAEALVFRFIGLKEQEQPIAGRTKIDVTMSADTEEMEEVLVVAYGTAKKSSFTGSAGQVSADKLSERSVSDATKALAGQVAGVQIVSASGQPGSATTVRIRGVGSMNASKNPLYVVDGVPYEGSISAINPSDIETMTVLKDASASAIYGARGANGVVLITTKKGKAGEARVTVDAKWGNNQRGVPNYDVMDDPRMYYETQYRALYNAATLNQGMSEAAAHNYANSKLVSSLGYPIFTVPEGERLVGTNFKVNPNATLGYYNPTTGNYYTPDDWYDETFLKQNIRQEYNISTGGNVDKINYYLSFGYLDDTGIINNTGFTRYTARVHADYQAKKFLKLGTNMSYTNYNMKEDDDTLTDWGSSGNAFYVANMIAPIYPMYYRNQDGSIKKDEAGRTRYDFGNNTDATRKFMNNSNPKQAYDLDDRDNEVDNFNGKWFITATPIEGLDITATVAATSINQRAKLYSNPLYGNAAGLQGYVDVQHQRLMAVNQQYLINYKKSINDIHNIDILAGYESFQYKIQNLEVARTKMYNPFLAEINNAVDDKPSVASSTDYYSTIGILGRVQYDYDGKYFLSGSFRRDGSSRFHPDNRWGTFGSAGAAWLMSEEDFIKDIEWIDMLKVKASYGVQGNDHLLTSAGYETYKPYEDIYSVSYSGDSTDPFSVSFSTKGNKDITWETSHSFNAGAEFEFLDGKISGSAEYFFKRTSDLLYYQPVPKVLGYSSFPTNVGEMENKGFEFELTGTIFKTNDIEWSVTLNGTHFVNEVTDLAETVKANGGIKGSSSIIKIGGTVYQSYMPKSAGVNKENGKEQYYVDPDNGDFSITESYDEAQQADCGTAIPKLYGGFATDLTAFGFDFSMQFSYQLGGQIYDGTYEDLMHTGQSDCAGTNWHKDILKAWTPENPNSNIPRISTDDNRRQNNSDRYLVSSNYLSFNSIVLGYTLPKNLTKKIFVEKLRVFGTCDNVALFAYRKGLDPRQNFAAGSTTTSGNFSYSALRTISGGVQIEF